MDSFVEHTIKEIREKSVTEKYYLPYLVEWILLLQQVCCPVQLENSLPVYL